MENSDHEDVYISYLKKPGDFPACHAIFPTQTCTIITELPQNDDKFAWFDPSKMGDWLTPELHSSVVSGTIMINGTISTFFMGGIFPTTQRIHFAPPIFVGSFPRGGNLEISSPVDGWKFQLSKVKGKRTSCRRALSVKLHPNHGKRRSAVWVNLSWVGPLMSWGIFFWGNFWALDFLGAKKLGAFSWKKAYENKESERIKHGRHQATHSWGVLCFFVSSAISLEVMAILKWIFSRVAEVVISIVFQPH